MTEKPQTHLTGTVEKIIKPLVPNEAEKVQIAVEQAEHMYKEIRIENTLTDPEGNRVELKPGAHVDVVIQADPADTTISCDCNRTENISNETATFRWLYL